MAQTSAKKMIGSALNIAPCPEFEAKLKQSKLRQAQLEHPALLDGPEHVIIGSRQEGKTTLALKWLQDCPAGVERILIVLNDDQAKHMRLDCGFPRGDPRIISYRTLLNGKSRSGVEYGIDETVSILMNLLGLREMPRLLTASHAEAWQGTGPDA